MTEIELQCKRCRRKDLEIINTLCYDLLYADGSDKGGEGIGNLCDDCLEDLEKWIDEYA